MVDNYALTMYFLQSVILRASARLEPFEPFHVDTAVSHVVMEGDSIGDDGTRYYRGEPN